MLIQGTNIPLKIVFDEDISEIPALTVTLWKNKQQLKRWDKEDMVITEDTAILPLSEAETAEFPAGPSTVEAKGLNADHEIVFWDEYNVIIHPRRDKDIALTEDGD